MRGLYFLAVDFTVTIEYSLPARSIYIYRSSSEISILTQYTLYNRGCSKFTDFFCGRSYRVPIYQGTLLQSFSEK